MSQLLKSNQKGFTLIELIMVIVILGILSAFAIPKFADLGDSARNAVLEGGKASIASGNAIAHSASLATGNASSVTLEGSAYTLSFGYPTITTIQTIAGISSVDYAIFTGTNNATSTPIAVFTAAGAVDTDNCFVYTESLSGGASSVSAIGAWDDDDASGALNAGDLCGTITLAN